MSVSTRNMTLRLVILTLTLLSMHHAPTAAATISDPTHSHPSKPTSNGADNGSLSNPGGGDDMDHHSNWALLINVSRYWFNYRHVANVLSLYHTVKKLGIPDDHIIMMTADDMACNPRNAYPSEVHNDKKKNLNLYGDQVEVDYRNYEVTLDNIVRVITGRHEPGTPRSKRLLSDANSNVLVYITGHGGNQFMKIQDHEEISAQDLADSIAQMKEKERYKSLLLVVETCQASTMYEKIDSPGVLSCASAKKNENSYSHHHDSSIGVSVIDRLTYTTLQFFEQITLASNKTLADLYKSYTKEALMSTFMHDESLSTRDTASIKVTDFFGNVAATSVTNSDPLTLAIKSYAKQCTENHLNPPTPPWKKGLKASSSKASASMCPEASKGIPRVGTRRVSTHESDTCSHAVSPYGTDNITILSFSNPFLVCTTVLGALGLLSLL